ncbi:MAG: hypothetical protein PF505_10600 [Vallitaleaceae bacterium]|nr:hypothetical protein [Vallitaleaceae bacterium]
MEEIIKRIIFIENKAQKVINTAEQEKISKQEDLVKRLEALEEKLFKDADKKIQVMRDKELAAANSKIEGMSESCTGKLMRIEQYSKDHKEEWCAGLYDAVIRGE